MPNQVVYFATHVYRNNNCFYVFDFVVPLFFEEYMTHDDGIYVIFQDEKHISGDCSLNVISDEDLEFFKKFIKMKKIGEL